MSETPQVLDGLHHHAHQTDLRIVEHYTDTVGTTDHVFGLCHLLGHRFAPRTKDLKDRKLYTVEKPGTWPLLAPLIGDTIETAAILGQWIKLIRLKASIETGAVGPSVILRKLAAAGADNVLSRPLRAPGRIERTLSPCNGYPIRRCANAAMPVSPRARPASCLRPSEAASLRHLNQSPCHRLQGRSRAPPATRKVVPDWMPIPGPSSKPIDTTPRRKSPTLSPFRLSPLVTSWTRTAGRSLAACYCRRWHKGFSALVYQFGYYGATQKMLKDFLGQG
jgi:hypothetical protein